MRTPLLAPTRCGVLGRRSSTCVAWRLGVVEDRLGLDLHPPARIEQAGNDNHRARRADLAENLPMDATDRLPVFPVDEVRARPDDVGRTPAELGQGGEDDREAPARLGRRIRIARSVRPDRGSAADEDPLSDPDGATEPDPRLERRSRRHPAALDGREVSRELRSLVAIGRDSPLF